MSMHVDLMGSPIVTYIDVDSMDVVRLLSFENHPPAVSCKIRER